MNTNAAVADAVPWSAMRALITTADGIALVERAAPVPGPDEVAIDVAYAGVCRTDLAVVDGRIGVPQGRVIGHELAGRVVGTGALCAVVPFVADRWLGIDRDGAFADRVCVPVQSLVPVPEGMSSIHAAYVEPVAAALGALASIRAGDRVLVEGHSRIAELARRVIAAHGGQLEACESYDVVVETSGVRDLAPLLARIRTGGTLVLKSRETRDAVLPASAVVARDLTIRGASHGSFADAVEWLHRGRIAIDDLIAEPRPLEDFAVTLAAAREESRKQMFRIEAR